MSTTEALEAAIRDEVLRQGFPPGAPLREAELTSRFRVGRNSVRAALQSLVHAGLLRHAQNRGVFVPDFTVADVWDVFLLRGALEGQAVTTITCNNRPVGEVEAALHRLESMPPDSDWLDITKADLDVHTAIVAASGGERMSRVYFSLILELRLLLAHVQDLYPQPETLVPGHREIVSALADRDEPRASAALRRHLEESAEQIIAAVSQARQTTPAA